MLYNNLSGYLKSKYGKKIKKLCIDGGFSCPNRDGRVGVGGCIFCGERGAGEHISDGVGIREQVKRFFSRPADADGFIAYFQNFTNTYAPIDTLRERYDAALCDERIVALAIGTRPDCIDEDTAALIASYKSRLDVWVELGLQSSSDKTAELINRGYPSSRFSEAVEILNRYDIPVVTHIMLGLPGEGMNEIQETVSFLNRHKIWGLKIHSVYVMKGTRLGQMYENNLYTPPTLSEYVEYATYTLSHISKKTVIHRLTGDCPEGYLLAPEWNRDKNKIIEEINRTLHLRGLRQGSHYSENP